MLNEIFKYGYLNRNQKNFFENNSDKNKDNPKN